MQFPVGRWLKQKGASTPDGESALLRAWAACVPPLSEALPTVLAELRRARRHERPMSLLVLGPHGDVSGRGNGGNGSAPNRGPADPPANHLDLFLLGLLLRETVRETDQVALSAEDRLYMVFLPETDDPQAREAAARLVRTVRGRVPVSPRAGLAGFPADGLTVEDLLVKARHTWEHRPLRVGDGERPEREVVSMETVHGG